MSPQVVPFGPLIQQGTGLGLGSQQSGPGQVASAPNVDPGAQKEVPAQGGNAPNQGQAKPNDPNLVVTPYSDKDGYSGTKTLNRTTGDTELHLTGKDPKTGELIEAHNIYNKSNQVVSASVTKTKPDPDPNNKGGQIVWKRELGANGEITKQSETHVNAKGDSSTTTNFDPKDPWGSKTSEVTVRSDGSTSTTNYFGSCQLNNPQSKACLTASKVETDPRTGKQTTTTFNEDGKPVSTKATDFPKAAMLKARQLNPAGDRRVLAGQRALTGNKDQLKADVLKNIGSKPAGDIKDQVSKLKTIGEAGRTNNSGAASNLNSQSLPPDKVGAKELVKGDVLEKIGSKPGGDLHGQVAKLKTINEAGRMNKSGAASSLNPQPLPPDKVGAKELVKGDVVNKIGSKPGRDLKNTSDKLKTIGMAGRMNKSGAASDLNPQPLPPGPPPNKTAIKHRFDDRFVTGRPEKYVKDDFTKETFTHSGNGRENFIQHKNLSADQFKGNQSHEFNFPAGGNLRWNRQ